MGNHMSESLMFSAVVGFFLPPLVAVIQQPHWPDWFRAVVGFLAAVVVSLGTLYFTGGLVLSGTGKEWIIFDFLLLLVTSISTYRELWKPTGIAPMIEQISSPGSKS